MRGRLKLSKGRVDVTGPDRKQALKRLEQQSQKSVSRLTQKYGVELKR